MITSAVVLLVVFSVVMIFRPRRRTTFPTPMSGAWIRDHMDRDGTGWPT